MWVLRIRYDGGSYTFREVDPSLTFRQLKTRVKEKISVPITRQKFLKGYPPSPVKIGDDDPISSSFANCDTLIMQQLPDPATNKNHKKRKRKGYILGEDASGNDILATTASNVVASDIAGERKATKTMEQATTAAKDHLGEVLINAITATGDDVTDIVRNLRKSFKDRLTKRYAERLATHRLSAAMSKKFDITDAGAYRLGDSLPTLKVSFKVGPRKEHEETFMKMPDLILQAIIQTIGADPDHKENLRPLHLAYFSPRVFWNVVVKFGIEYEGHLPTFVPTVDWRYLAQRPRELTEKALRNKQMMEDEQRHKEEAKAKRLKIKEAREAKKAAKDTVGSTSAVVACATAANPGAVVATSDNDIDNDSDHDNDDNDDEFKPQAEEDMEEADDK